MKKFFRDYTRKYFCLAVGIVLLPILSPYAKAAPQNDKEVALSELSSMPSPNLGPNLVVNGDFEISTESWDVSSNHAQVVSGAAYSGTHSLYYNNADKDHYKLFSQNVNVKPGQILHFSAWIKGKNIKGPSRSEGASLYMESSSSSGYIGGTFPARITGTFDWRRITGEYYVPQNAIKTSVGLYLRKGATGEVWFDDVQVREISVPSFMPFMQYPNYRGMVKQGDNTPWKSLVQVNKQDDWKDGSVKINYELIDGAGKVLLKESRKSPANKKEVTITFTPPKNLPVGDYLLKQTFTDPNGRIIAHKQDIRIVRKMPKVYIDADGFTVVDGKRFFPMGTYIAPTSDEDMARIAKGGFNAILSYSHGAAKWEEYMDRAQKHDLKVLFSLKNMYPGHQGYGDEAYDVAAKIVKNVRHKPALLGWYTNDEMNGSWLPQLHEMYEKIQKLDSAHPTIQVLDNKTLPHKDVLQRFFYVTDVWADDPYPVGRGNKDLTMTSDYTRLARAASHDVKGMWVVAQLMDWGIYRKDAEMHQPSLDEMRNQAYQAIISGATGLFWYTYYDLKYTGYPRNKENIDMDVFDKRWTDASNMAQEINKITPVVLENQKVLLDIPEKAEIEAAAWQDGDELLILLANPYYEAKNITFALPVGWKIKDANQGQIKSTFADGKVTLLLPSIGSGVFRLVK